MQRTTRFGYFRLALSCFGLLCQLVALPLRFAEGWQDVGDALSFFSLAVIGASALLSLAFSPGLRVSVTLDAVFWRRFLRAFLFLATLTAAAALLMSRFCCR